MRRHENKRGGMAAVRCREGCSPEMTAWERADGFKMPAGNSETCELASTLSPPGIIGPVELEWRRCGNHGDPDTGACSQRAVPNKPNQRGRGRQCWEVGDTYSSDELG
jgi:hypothetical protein